MTPGLNFIAIDFETATAKRASICEAGICVVKDGEIVETLSWLVRPENNSYSFWNIEVHGITPDKTENSPEFPVVWNKILTYLKETPILVAHNAAFDISCIRKSLELFKLPTPAVNYFCTLRAARKLYDFESNTLDCVCREFGIKVGNHHRAGDDAEMCARIFLHQIKDNGIKSLDELNGLCGGVL